MSGVSKKRPRTFVRGRPSLTMCLRLVVVRQESEAGERDQGGIDLARPCGLGSEERTQALGNLGQNLRQRHDVLPSRD